MLKTYDSNIKLLQETEKTIKDIKNMIFEATDIASLVNLNNKFLAEDAKLKLEDKKDALFMPFVNVETNQVNVLYKREDGSFGIVIPE